MKTNILSEAEYKTLKARHEAFEVWRGGRCSYKTDEVPAGLNITNAERSQIEVYEFVKNPPDRYFAYVKPVAMGATAEITTWTGEVLGMATLGTEYRMPGFGGGSKRRAINKFTAINGKVYYGTYYSSSGDYCMLKAAKV